MVRLYYYMERIGFEGIIRTRKIMGKPTHGGVFSLPNGGHLTELKPYNDRNRDIILKNYDDFQGVLDFKRKTGVDEYPVNTIYWIIIDSKDFADELEKMDTNEKEWIIIRDIELDDCVGRKKRAGKLRVGYGDEWPGVGIPRVFPSIFPIKH